MLSCGFDEADNVIETHEHVGDLKSRSKRNKSRRAEA
jgi:hypothetical protein